MLPTWAVTTEGSLHIRVKVWLLTVAITFSLPDAEADVAVHRRVREGFTEDIRGASSTKQPTQLTQTIQVRDDRSR